MGLIQRAIEAEGITTVGITISRKITAAIRPPRSLFVDFPMGRPMGRAFDEKTQRAVLVEALEALESITEPGSILDSPLRWKGSATPVTDRL